MVLAFGGGFVGLTLGSLLALLREHRDKGFRTSAQVQQQIGSLIVSATPRAIGRQRKSPADIILKDNRSAFAEAFRVSWANIHLAVAGPRSASLRGRRQGIALGITSAASGEGKSTHALGLARTAALAGEKVVLVDADLRRSGVSRLLDPDPRFTLRDFLEGRCAADDVIDIEERSGVRFVSSASSNFPWTSQDLQRFSSFVDYLKNRFTIVIIDLPPVLGLAETIRLAMAADKIALVIRWGRTERQFVQSALDALRSASVPTIAVTPTTATRMPGTRLLPRSSRITASVVIDPTRPMPIGVPLTGHQSYINALAYRPDGHPVATASAVQTVRI